jgi:hypothetical protein
MWWEGEDFFIETADGSMMRFKGAYFTYTPQKTDQFELTDDQGNIVMIVEPIKFSLVGEAVTCIQEKIKEDLKTKGVTLV